MSSRAGSSRTADDIPPRRPGRLSTHANHKALGGANRPTRSNIKSSAIASSNCSPRGLASAGSTKPGSPNATTSSRPLEALSHPPADSVPGQVTSSAFPLWTPVPSGARSRVSILPAHAKIASPLHPRQKLGGHVRATGAVLKPVKEERVSEEVRFSLLLWYT